MFLPQTNCNFFFMSCVVNRIITRREPGSRRIYMATRVAAAAESKKGEREKVAAAWLCVSRSAGCFFSVSSSIHVLSLYSPLSLCIHSVCHILVPKPGNSRRSTVFVRESRENALIVWLQTFTVKIVRRNQIVEILVNSFF